MRKFAFIVFALAAATPLWSQVEPSASGGDIDLGDSQMMTPPPVSGEEYPRMAGSESRSNFLLGGVVFTGAYIDNVTVPNSTTTGSDGFYSVLPTISLDRRTPRQGESLYYSSGFSFYQNESELNSVSQQGSAQYRFHLSPYAVISVGDSFRQNSNLFNQTNPFSGGGVSGSSGASDSVLVAPLANQIGNESSAEIAYQYGRNAMIGGNGSYSFLNYSNVTDLSGLANQDSADASAFFSRRMGRAQYIGGTYKFEKSITQPIKTYTQTQTVFGFYTIYFTKRFSVSVTGGPEHFTAWSPTTVKQQSWTPGVQGSVGWQGKRNNLAASLSHVVSGAGGLIGTFHSDSADLTARFLLSERWGAGANVEYATLRNVVSGPVPSSFAGAGHTVSGGAYLERKILKTLIAQGGYGRFHQSYGNIPSSTSAPDTDRAYFSVIFQFNRPLGR